MSRTQYGIHKTRSTLVGKNLPTCLTHGGRRQEEYGKGEKRKYTPTRVRAECKANIVSKCRRQQKNHRIHA